MEPGRETYTAAPLRDRPGLRTGLRVLTFAEADQEDRRYWHARTPVERLQHVEVLRELNYGREILDEGLQRVLTVSERARG